MHQENSFWPKRGPSLTLCHYFIVYLSWGTCPVRDIPCLAAWCMSSSEDAEICWSLICPSPNLSDDRQAKKEWKRLDSVVVRCKLTSGRRIEVFNQGILSQIELRSIHMSEVFLFKFFYISRGMRVCVCVCVCGVGEGGKWHIYSSLRSWMCSGILEGPKWINKRTVKQLWKRNWRNKSGAAAGIDLEHPKHHQLHMLNNICCLSW